MARLISFDLWGPFAHFRIPLNTTSPNTYPFPPKTVIIGMLGNILGMTSEIYPINDNPYYRLFDKVKIGLEILNPIRKHTMGIRYQAVKNGGIGPGPTSNRAPIPIGILINPKYKVYVKSESNEITNGLISKISNTNPTPYLGLSEMIANINNLQVHDIKTDTAKIMSTTCILPSSSGVPKLNPGVVGVKLPVSVNEHRDMKFEMVFYNRYNRNIEFTPKDKQVRVGEKWIPLY